MSVIDELKAQIAAGKITFDPPQSTADRLRQELLGENAGTKVTAKLQSLVLEISKLQNIRISSIIRDATGADSHHKDGKAFDVGNEEIATALLNIVATDARVAALNIDEIIFDAAKAIPAQANRNKWNYDEGIRHTYSPAVLDAHGNHIHFAVKS